MKRKLFLFNAVLLGATIAAIAQITITSSHINTAGNQLIEASDESPDASLSVGSPGSGQSWNFAALQEDGLDTVFFVNPTGLPGSTDFPGANLAITYATDEDSSWIFLQNSATELRTLGFTEVFFESGVIDTFSVPFAFRVLSFPSSLGTTFSETTEGFNLTEEFGFDPDGPGPHPFVDSIRFSSAITMESEIDGEGTITLPTGTFDALRQYSLQITSDSIFMLANGNWSLISATLEAFLGEDAVSQDTSFSYRWWTDIPTIGFPLIETEVDSDDNLIESIRWIKTSPVGIAQNSTAALQLYPNPASGLINIQLEGNDNSRHLLYVYDATGRQVKEMSINSNRDQMNVEDLQNGVYFYQLINAQGQAVANGKLSVQQ